MGSPSQKANLLDTTPTNNAVLYLLFISVRDLLAAVHFLSTNKLSASSSGCVLWDG